MAKEGKGLLAGGIKCKYTTFSIIMIAADVETN